MNKLLRIEIVKNRDGASAREEWRNTYGIEMTDVMIQGDAGGVGIRSDAVKAVAHAILDGETKLHVTGVRVLRAIVSTPEPGDKGLPDSVRVIGWGRLASRPGNPGVPPLPLEHVLKISFGSNAGRVSANQYRGALYADDVQIGGSGYQLVAGLDSYLGDSLMVPIDNADVRKLLRTIRVKGGVVSASVVDNIVLTGIGFRQRTQKKKNNAVNNPAEATRVLQEAQASIFTVRGFIEKVMALTPEDDVVRALQGSYNYLRQRILDAGVPGTPQLPPFQP